MAQTIAGGPDGEAPPRRAVPDLRLCVRAYRRGRRDDQRRRAHRAAARRRASIISATTRRAMLAAIEADRDAIEAGIGRDELQQLMPPGGARNALDCALVGARGGAGRRAGLGAGRARGAAGRWSPPSRSAPTIRKSWPRGARDYARGARDQGQADRRDRARPRPGRGGARGAARRLARRRRQSGLRAARRSTGWSRRCVEQHVSLLEQPLRARRRGGSRRLQIADPDRRRRKRAQPRRSARAGRPLRRRQHQARQMRRPYRGAGHGRGGAPARPRRDGRQHGRHQPCHGARLSCSASSATSSISTARPSSTEDRRPGVVYRDGLHRLRRGRLGRAGKRAA